MPSPSFTPYSIARKFELDIKSAQKLYGKRGDYERRTLENLFLLKKKKVLQTSPKRNLLGRLLVLLEGLAEA